MVLFVAASTVEGPGLEQPLPFNHALHAEQDLACVDCHQGVERGRYATLPSLAACQLCHEAEDLEPAEEPGVEDEEHAKRQADLGIARYAEELGYIPWVVVNRTVGHVYFSHEAHVVYGELACAECHGDVAARTEPVRSPDIGHLTMERCMECHSERGAANSCLVCHQ